MRRGPVCALALLVWACGCKPEVPATATAPVAAPAAPAAAPLPASAPEPRTPARDAVFGRPQLDQMLAPIALYPDKLVAQVLMAATYPGEVADAARWSQGHPGLMGDEAVRRVGDQPWDASVQALVAFPQVLALMAQAPSWVQKLGDAYLAQPDDVLDSIQRLRRKAQQAGHLASNEYQTVGTGAPAPEASAAEPSSAPAPAASEAEEIFIEPVNEELVYVPYYDADEVYGEWEDDWYLPAYFVPPAGYYPGGGALARGIAFGLGVAIVGGLWGDIDWNGGDIDIDIDRYNRKHVAHHRAADNGTWRHDPVHRQGVPYRDRVSQERYRHSLAGVAARDAYRGDEGDRARARAQSRESMRQAGFATPPASHRQAVEDAGAAEREAQRARDHAMAMQGQRENAREQARIEAVQQERQLAAQRERELFPERERQQAEQRQRAQNNERERQAARQRYAAQQQRQARQSAFEGVRQEQGGREQRTRSAQRPSGGRGGGHAVSRPSRR